MTTQQILSLVVVALAGTAAALFVVRWWQVREEMALVGYLVMFGWVVIIWLIWRGVEPSTRFSMTLLAFLSIFVERIASLSVAISVSNAAKKKARLLGKE